MDEVIFEWALVNQSSPLLKGLITARVFKSLATYNS